MDKEEENGDMHNDESMQCHVKAVATTAPCIAQDVSSAIFSHEKKNKNADILWRNERDEGKKMDEKK